MSDVVLMVVFFLAGGVALVRGVAMVSPAVAWMVTGVLLVAVALWPIVRARVTAR